MRINKTKLHLDGEGGVIATRTTIPDHGSLAKLWTQVIIKGEPQEKPSPDVFGDDHWPDWEKLVAKAQRKLLSKPRKRPEKADPDLPPRIGDKWFHGM
jgi:hypothetical protein